MSFIGVFANKKCFETIQKQITKKIKEQNLQLVQINLKSIENVKNIKFETIIIEDSLEKFKNHKETLEKILENTQYLIINTDKNQEEENQKHNTMVITYGLNQKANVTISSITETDVLTYLQKAFKNKEGEKIEIEERRIKRKLEKGRLTTYEILIIYTILKLYQKSIIEEI